jgi:multidrug efflux pump subunit AcrB
MKGILSWFAKNPVAANLVMIVLLVGGAMTAFTVKMELFPEFSMDMVTVSVPYPGAAPEEVEEAICVRIEEEVHAIDGVKRVSSSAVEGAGTVTIEVMANAEVRDVLDEVKTRVNAIATFPELAEKPIIQEIVMRAQVINVAVSGEADEATLKHLGEELRDELSNLPGISQVVLAGAREYEISIEVSEEQLRRHGLSFEHVAQAVRGSSLDLSGGSMKTDSGEILVRTKGQAYSGEDFASLVLLTRPDGSRLLVGDVATVIDGFADNDKASRFNGAPAVQVQVYRVGDENALEVADKVKEYVATARHSMPAGVSLTLNSDQSDFLKGRLQLLVNNGVQGLLLVFCVLALFLRFRLAFWVAMGIPISFMGALWFLPGLDMSINMLSLFAFILVLGIVVDDAIIVGESIYTEQEKGGSLMDGAIRGAHRVATPVTFAILTSVAAFSPLLGLPGMFGKFFGVMPTVVIPILVFSWVESKIILPAHLAHGGAFTERLAQRAPFKWWVAVQGVFERGLTGFANRVYRPVLEVSLRWRYLTHAIVISSMLFVLGLIGGKYIRFVDFPKIDGDVVAAQLSMPLGTPASVTEEAVARIEQAAFAVQRELQEQQAELQGGEDGGDVVRHFMTAVGDQPFKAMQENHGTPGALGVSSAHLGEVVMELAPTEQREFVQTKEVVARWRELCGPIPGAVELVFSADIMSGGDAILIEFAGQDIDELRAAADELKAELVKMPGVYDTADSFRGGKQELQLEILPSAEALGLTLADLARQVRQGFYGEEAQRIQRGRDEVKVMVRYPVADRRTLYALENMRIRTPQGAELPFSAVARAKLGRGYATIRRADRERVIMVTSDVDDKVTSASEAIAALSVEALPRIITRHPSVSWSVQGENRELTDTMAELGRKFVIALLAIFALMAIPFKSYIQPLIVMSAIPLGLVGAVIGHVIMGKDLSILSMMGLVALSGVVVNDSLVLVDYINSHAKEAGSLFDAVCKAGVRRFRPIMLTSLTTFAGLTPLMFEKSVQAQFLVPMAIALAYGVMFSTVVTLVFVPSGYLILDDLKRAVLGVGRLYSGAEPKAAGDVVAERS